ARHPAVLECAVVAVPDEKWGERPKAFVTLKPGRTATAPEIIDFCRQHIAHFKCPAAVEFGDLPKTSTGKVQKFVLREKEWKGRERGINWLLRRGGLDQSPVGGGGPADPLHETLELAEVCDRLGYYRYWLAEHHATPGLAGSSPEVLIGQVAARTSRIRVGSGGVMLQHYSPPKAAESFRELA